MYKQLARPAKVGEKILIVSPRSHRTYQQGDMFNVTSTYETTIYVQEKNVSIYHDEYVVLFDISQRDLIKKLIDYELMVLNDAITMKADAEKQMDEAIEKLHQLQSEYAALPFPV